MLRPDAVGTKHLGGDAPGNRGVTSGAALFWVL